MSRLFPVHRLLISIQSYGADSRRCSHLRTIKRFLRRVIIQAILCVGVCSKLPR